MATKVFAKALMASEDVQAYVGSCKFGTGTDASFTAAQVTDGAFVTLGGLALDETYSATSLDWNVYHAYAPTSAALTREDVVVVDISGVSEGVIAGNNYKIGNKQVDLVGKPGYAVRFRRLQKGDKFWLGQGCFTSAPTVGKFANLTANAVTLTPAASATDAQLNIKVLASKALTVGITVNTVSTAFEQLYLCEVL